MEEGMNHDVNEELVVYDIWDDWGMRLIFWLVCSSFGWLIGWTLGAVA
jgi:hypothetical protein